MTAVARLVSVMLLALATGACSIPYIPGLTPAPPAGGVDLKDANGKIVGKGVLVQEGRKVRLLLDVTGLPPGFKGVHLHAVGRCDPPSFESAGPHFNPASAQHGSQNPRGPHAGDLPNITVDGAGTGHLEFSDLKVSLHKKDADTLFGPNGTSLVLHADPDDLRTDPDGKSGARIACGVIQPAR